MDNKNAFNYTYSAKTQEEIKTIRQKYLPAEEDKMTTLRRLDAAVTQRATTVSLVFGIIGALVLGFGMSLLMTDLGAIFGAYQRLALPVGIVVGVVGIALVSTAYPLYNRILKKERERIAPEILRLTDELMK